MAFKYKIHIFETLIITYAIKHYEGRGSGTTNNSLAEVVYGMVRARRRRTFKRLQTFFFNDFQQNFQSLNICFSRIELYKNCNAEKIG